MKDGKYELEETKFGFTWGPLTVERIASDPNRWGAVVSIMTARESIDIRVTPGGKIKQYAIEKYPKGAKRGLD